MRGSCLAVAALALSVVTATAGVLPRVDLPRDSTVACAHGVMPVPAPATLQLLKNVPIYSGDIQKELVTPTGAAIAKVLVSSFGSRPVMTTERIGCGAGARDFAGHANVLRLTVGETQETVTGADSAGEIDAEEEEIAILEANLDDLNPQFDIGARRADHRRHA